MTKPIKPWTEQEDYFLEENYSGDASIPFIAKSLKRTEVATEKRIRIIRCQDPKIVKGKDFMACVKHGENLLRSGKKWT